MPQMTLPNTPVADWEKERDSWIAVLEQLSAEVERWARSRDWAVRREQKQLREDRLGMYAVPVLTIQSPQGRLLMNPVARFVVGASGRVDLDAFPSFASVPLIRTEAGWGLKSEDPPEVDRPWSEESFAEVAAALMSSP